LLGTKNNIVLRFLSKRHTMFVKVLLEIETMTVKQLNNRKPQTWTVCIKKRERLEIKLENKNKGVQ
jgi:hypothetical protein